MSPRVLGVETGDAGKRHPAREPSDKPEADPETTSQAAQVAEFRTSRVQVSLPAMVLVALISAVSAAAVAWINKPTPTATAVLSPEQAAQLQTCAKLQQDVAEIKTFVVWAQPQIGLLLMRTDARPYAPPPPAVH